MLASCSLKAFGGKGPSPQELIPGAWQEPGSKANAPPAPYEVMSPDERKAYLRQMQARANEKRLDEREQERRERKQRRRG